MNDQVSFHRRALVVEDDPDFAALVETLLEEEGFSTSVAFNGEDALTYIRYRRPDLVTLDIQLPRRSGLLFYRQMKSEESLRDVPVIVITGLTRGDRDMDNIIHSFLEVDHLPSPQAYLEKPFQQEEFLAVLRDACPAG